MTAIYSNLRAGTITDNPLGSTDTTINSAEFADLPVVASPDYLWLTLDPESAVSTPEIVKVTAHSSGATSVTVVRGEQTSLGGNASRSHSQDTRWVASWTAEDGELMPHRVLTAKGDILAATGANTIDRLGVGTDGYFLKADSGESTGLVWGQVDFSTANLDDLGDVTITSAQAGQFVQWNGTAWVNAVMPSGEPIGHQDKTESTISFSNSTRVFTIAPVSSSHVVWCKGVKHTKTSSETVTIPDTTGLYYVYYNESGTLGYKTTYFVWDTDTPTAYIYWNATTGEAEFFADERHGITLDWQTHEYLHRTRGAVIASGFGASNYVTDGNGGSDGHAQLDIANGTFFDEDLQVDITHSATPTANTWEQVLQGAAEIPVMYQVGTEWQLDTATEFPIKAGTALPRYNSVSGSTWSLTDLGNSKFGVSWIVATNNLNEPVIAIMGQGEYNNIGEAEATTWEELDLTGFPVFEFRVLYKIAFQVASGYTNTIKAAIRGVYDLRRTTVAGDSIPTIPVADHGSLTGLADDDHTQYLNESRHDALDHSTALGSAVVSDLSDVSSTSPTSGQILKWSGSDWSPSDITLGTETSGDYVESLTAGTGVSVGTATGEGSTPTIAIGQSVGTTDDVTFNTVTGTNGIITLTTSGAPTSSLSDGAIAIDTSNNILYIRSGGAWIESSGGGASVSVSDTAPSSPDVGDLWFESDTGDVFVYYDSAWIDIGGTSVANIATSDTAPSSPANGDIWFETDTAKTFVWYDDGSSQQWVEIGAASSSATGSSGAIQFANGNSAFSSDGANLFWDDTNNRLGVGTNSPAVALDVVGTTDTDYLTVGGENVTPYTGKRNLLINGAMQVYQRASSGDVLASEGYRCADRWKSYRTVNAAGTLSVNTTDAPEGFNNSLNYACTSAEATPTNETFVSQVLEGQDVQHVGYGKSWCKQVTVSFWVKSNVTGTFNVWFFRWDGTRHIGRSYTINSADTWEYKTVLVPADTSNAVANDNTQGWEVRFYLAAQSTWTGGTEASAWSAVSDNNRAPGNANINSSTSNYWRVTGVQVEVGDKATPFEHRSFGEELALCQRYYFKPPQHYYSTLAYGTWIDFSAFLRASMPIPVTMRANPSVTYSSYFVYGAGGSRTGSGTIYVYGQDAGMLVLGFGHSGSSPGGGYVGTITAPSGFEVNAEL